MPAIIHTMQIFYFCFSRTLVGPKCYPPSQVAALYNINKEFLTFDQFKTIMQNLPEYVSDDDVKTMFGFADKDNNGYISYKV